MSKASVNMSTEELTVSSSKQGSGRKNMILMIVLVLVVVLAIIFIALYASSNNKNDNLEVQIGKLENEIKSKYSMIIFLYYDLTFER